LKKLKKLPARFYQTPNGSEPVREWLLDLDDEDRKLIGADIATAEYGWPVGMPLSRPLGKGLFEIRTNLTDGKISRVIFAVVNQHMALLHGFVKKTQKTPKTDLDLALKRLKEIQ
jgi:phage-related protein